MKIAIEGCCHGELDDIYGSIRLIEQRDNIKIDLVLICGDFQSVRNEADAICMSVPEKYRQLGTFWKYYSGRERAPYPTIFIGGNHEASNYLWELYYGGWVCDNIYYMGSANVIEFGGLRIGGLSGIYKSYHYNKGHYETSPYSEDHKRSVYHYREYDVKKLLQVQAPLDIFMSHDWPRGVERYGNLLKLMREKKFFINEIMNNSLGSEPNLQLLKKLKPDYWFSAHLHVHYAALVDHNMLAKGEYPTNVQLILDRSNPPSTAAPPPSVENKDEIIIDVDFETNDVAAENVESGSNSNSETVTDSNDSKLEDTANTENNKRPSANNSFDESQRDALPSTAPKYTKFLSLDKCLPRRKFLQIVDIPSPHDDTKDYDFYYDLEWLAITRALNPYLATSYQQTHIPFSDDELQELIKKEKAYLKSKEDSGFLDRKIPHNFEPTAPAFNPDIRPTDPRLIDICQHPFSNPQTVKFCNEIDIDNKINAGCRQSFSPEAPVTVANFANAGATTTVEPNNDLPHDEPIEMPSTKRTKLEDATISNPSEITIDDDDLL